MTSKGRLSAFFFFNDTATTEIYTLSLHDALPISIERRHDRGLLGLRGLVAFPDAFDDAAGLVVEILGGLGELVDRKSTRLNSSHLVISYAVFCLKKKIIA